MQTTSSFIKTFSLLGLFLQQFPENKEAVAGGESAELEKLNRLYFKTFSEILDREPVLNPWFTPDALKKALEGIASMLEKKVLQGWLEPYDIKALKPGAELSVGLVMAGNIPLVGFHDMMSVLASGHKVFAKASSKDNRLIKEIAKVLTSINPALGSRIKFNDDTLKGMDAVIATGSDNSARYFEYYFKNIPHIIRKNRNGVAVLSGSESEEELEALGEDIFTYFGMGCRNVTKLFIPENYDLKILLGVLDRFQALYQHNKYGNNVDYYRTIYLMKQVPLLDNGVLLLKEDTSIASPVGVVFYERYSDLAKVQQELELHHQEIQCIVTSIPEIEGAIRPGTSQIPKPWDYADGVDTIRFLMELS